MASQPRQQSRGVFCTWCKAIEEALEQDMSGSDCCFPGFHGLSCERLNEGQHEREKPLDSYCTHLRKGGRVSGYGGGSRDKEKRAHLRNEMRPSFESGIRKSGEKELHV